MGQSLNFANQNLRDRDFKGKNLIGANFSGADIRGCNFCRSQLKSANFANVRAGRSPRQNAIASLNGFAMACMFAGTAMIASILMIAFGALLLFGMSVNNSETVYGVAIVAIVIFAVSFAIAFTGRFAIAGISGTFLAVLISLLIAFSSGFLGSTFAKILVSGAFNAIADSLRFNTLLALLGFFAIESLQIFGSLYLLRFTIHPSRSNIGTRFQYANLTKASFHRATLVNCDFSYAVMDEVDWELAQVSRCKL
jgi:uncharacterized protein YjbI with pentapeptide repeats